MLEASHHRGSSHSSGCARRLFLVLEAKQPEELQRFTGNVQGIEKITYQLVLFLKEAATISRSSTTKCCCCHHWLDDVTSVSSYPVTFIDSAIAARFLMSGYWHRTLTSHPPGVGRAHSLHLNDTGAESDTCTPCTARGVNTTRTVTVKAGCL